MYPTPSAHTPTSEEKNPQRCRRSHVTASSRTQRVLGALSTIERYRKFRIKSDYNLKVMGLVTLASRQFEVSGSEVYQRSPHLLPTSVARSLWTRRTYYNGLCILSSPQPRSVGLVSGIRQHAWAGSYLTESLTITCLDSREPWHRAERSVHP